MTADEFITDNHALMMYQPFLEPSKTTANETGEIKPNDDNESESDLF
ncbi:hypothetical protein [Paenibacillus kobensis]|nr:hypothetical protein [Paenibacillus kobensis]